MRFKFRRGIADTMISRGRYRYWMLRVGPYMLTTVKDHQRTELFLIKNDFRNVIFTIPWWPAEEVASDG